MTPKGNLITEWIEIGNFLDILRQCPEIEITEHARMRLSEKQREMNEKELRETIWQKVPQKIGLQSNGLYALFYEKNKEEYTKIIMNVISAKLFIVTFHNVDKQELPRLK